MHPLGDVVGVGNKDLSLSFQTSNIKSTNFALLTLDGKSLLS